VKLGFGRVLKRFLSAYLMRVKLVLFTFYLNGGLHAVSVRKPSEWMSHFWTVWFLKTESEPNFAFPHIPRHNVSGVVPMHSGQIAPEQTRSSH